MHQLSKLQHGTTGSSKFSRHIQERQRQYLEKKDFKSALETDIRFSLGYSNSKPDLIKQGGKVRFGTYSRNGQRHHHGIAMLKDFTFSQTYFDWNFNSCQADLMVSSNLLHIPMAEICMHSLISIGKKVNIIIQI